MLSEILVATRMPPYIMESPDEAERLDRKTREQDSLDQLTLLGLEPGMRVLDAGAGTGAVARTIARVVGSKGRVVALDRSRERLLHCKDPNLPQLEVVEGDLSNIPLDSSVFDLVWCRFVFEYLDNPRQALNELIRVTRIGGRVVVADLDGNGMFHFPIEKRLQSDLARLQDTLRGSLDPFVGRKLFNYFRAAGLADIRVHLLPYHLYVGTADEGALENWKAKFSTIRPYALRAFPTERAYHEFVESFMAMLRDPDTFTYSVLIIVVGERKQ